MSEYIPPRGALINLEDIFLTYGQLLVRLQRVADYLGRSVDVWMDGIDVYAELSADRETIRQRHPERELRATIEPQEGGA